MLDINDLFDAIYESDLSILQKEVDVHGIDPNTVHQDGGHSFLQAACQEDCIEVIGLLLSLGADPNKRITRVDIGGRVIERDSTALASVCSVGAAELLVNAGADIDIVDGNGLTPVVRAAKRRDLKLVDFLCSSGANYKGVLHVGKKEMTAADLIAEEITSYKKILGKSLNEKQAAYLAALDAVKLRLMN